jgi:hypothetical protein
VEGERHGPVGDDGGCAHCDCEVSDAGPVGCDERDEDCVPGRVGVVDDRLAGPAVPDTDENGISATDTGRGEMVDDVVRRDAVPGGFGHDQLLIGRRVGDATRHRAA